MSVDATGYIEKILYNGMLESLDKPRMVQNWPNMSTDSVLINKNRSPQHASGDIAKIPDIDGYWLEITINTNGEPIDSVVVTVVDGVLYYYNEARYLIATKTVEQIDPHVLFLFLW